LPSQNYAADVEDNFRSHTESLGLSQKLNVTSSVTKEAMQAYEENEAKEYFANRTEQ
jgi:hypothetical protein